jgi:1-acyl-sn-glycerol-3-phosphate acyltransferase
MKITKITMIIMIIFKLSILYIIKVQSNNIINYLKMLFMILYVFPGSYLLRYKSLNKICWWVQNQVMFKNNIKYCDFKPIKNNGFIIISNHINLTDVCIISKMINCHVVAKSSVITKEYPQLKLLEHTLYKNLNLISYKRGNKKSGEKVKNKILSYIKNKENVLIFPEGTSSKNCYAGLHKFKKGIFHLAYENNIRILPIILFYESNDCGVVANKQNLNFFKIFNDTSDIHTQMLNFMYPKNFENFDLYYDYIFNTMNNVLNNYIKKYTNKQLKK